MCSLIRGRQQGAALIIALLILLVMSILAITSVTTTSMEEKMASNTRQERIAFEAAEAALRTAEEWLMTQIPNRSQLRGRIGANSFLYSEVSSPLSGLAPISWDISNPGNWSASNSEPVTNIPMFPVDTNRPRYVIEYIGRVGEPPLNYRDPDVRQFAFRITAMGWGLDATAHYRLQSTIHMPL